MRGSDNPLYPPTSQMVADLGVPVPGPLLERDPAAATEALRRLEGRIDAGKMVAMNARAKLDRVPEPEVAALEDWEEKVEAICQRFVAWAHAPDNDRAPGNTCLAGCRNHCGVRLLDGDHAVELAIGLERVHVRSDQCDAVGDVLRLGQLLDVLPLRV